MYKLTSRAGTFARAPKIWMETSRCIFNCFGLCRKGDDCKHKHADNATAEVRDTRNYKRLLDFYGVPVVYNKKVAAKAKAKAQQGASS